MNSGKVPYFRDNYHRPRNWFLEGSAPAPATRRLGSRDRERRGHHHHHQYHLSMTWQIAALNALSWRVQFAKNSIYTPGSMAAQHCHCHQFCFPAKMVHHHDMILFAQLVTSSEGCCLHYIYTWFYAEDKNRQVGEFFIHGEIQKTDIWICFYWQFVSSFKIPVLGKRWTMKFKVPWMHGLNF